jgi:hypothetical protein
MKKILKVSAKIIIALIAIIIAAMILVPVLFKKQIREVVVSQVNGMVNARVEIGDYSLGFFKSFPNLSFSLKDVFIIGQERFEGDTIAGFDAFSVVFNLGSLFGDEGYEVKSIIVDRPLVRGRVLTDGTANWDIMKPSETAEVEPADTLPAGEESTEGSLRLLLRRFLINQASISYDDEEMKMSADLRNLNFSLSGDMTMTETELAMKLDIDAVDVVYDGVRYLRNAVIGSEINLMANLDDMIFYLSDNFLALNDLTLNLDGSVAMPGDDINTDITFSTTQTSFKSLLSMVPAVYMTGFEALRADGTFELGGTVQGTYSEADSTLPDVKLSLAVRDGMISYPDLPERISAIAVDLSAAVDGSDMDKSEVDLSRFHFELAGNPFDLALNLKTPMSDPEVKAKASGKIDLASLAKAIPMEGMNLSGLFETSLDMAGRMSMIEQERYQDFHAAGSMTIGDLTVAMTDLPPVTISKAALLFNPAEAELKECLITVGRNTDLNIAGSLSNYIPYLFSDATIKGNLTLGSRMIDLDEIMAAFPADTVTEEDTTALALIVIPRNIDFTFRANIEKLAYGSIKPTGLRGNIIVRDGTVTVEETGMEIMGGRIVMNALYDTRDTLKPIMSADMAVENMMVKAAWETFNSIQKLAPAAKGIDGAISLKLKFESLLGSDMMPLVNTLMGEGVLTSDELQVVDMPTFSKMRDVLKLGSNYTNTIKDLRASFRVRDGRVFLSPFDTKLGNVKLNISGDQGFDQTLNYLIKTEIPRQELGSAANELVNDLTSRASGLGIPFTPSDIIKVNLKVGGTALKPDISPDFGGTGGAASSVVAGVKEQVKEEVKETVTEAVDEATAKARAEAEAQAARIMKEAEEKARMIRDEAASAAEKIRTEGEEQSQRILKEAEGKNAIVRTAAERSAQALRNEASRKADQLVKEADTQAQKLLDEAAAKRDELLKKL